MLDTDRVNEWTDKGQTIRLHTEEEQMGVRRSGWALA